jgi:hypothetical protein
MPIGIASPPSWKKDIHIERPSLCKILVSKKIKKMLKNSNSSAAPRVSNSEGVAQVIVNNSQSSLTRCE